MLEDAEGYIGYTGELTDEMVKLLEAKGYMLNSRGTLDYPRFMVHNSNSQGYAYGTIWGVRQLERNCKVITPEDLTSKKQKALRALRNM